MCTDISVNSASTLFNKYKDYQLAEVITPKGENVRGEKFMEFYLDEEAFKEMVIDVFYKEK